jgi:hypothetical protein
MGAFVWNAGGSEAVLREEGAANVLGTEHDVPPGRACLSCHGGEPGRILGFSALQLPPALLERLVMEGRLSPRPLLATFAASSEVRAALGYLHANCGHCHSENGLAFRDVDLVLRRHADEATPEQTAIYRTTVGVELARRTETGAVTRVVPGRPEDSGLLVRLRAGGARERMPPLGTERVDPSGSSRIETWITGLATTKAIAE